MMYNYRYDQEKKKHYQKVTHYPITQKSDGRMIQNHCINQFYKKSENDKKCCTVASEAGSPQFLFVLFLVRSKGSL